MGISKLALAWDSSIRKELMDQVPQPPASPPPAAWSPLGPRRPRPTCAQAGTVLSGSAKDEGARINKLVLNDLKGLDKLAKVRGRTDGDVWPHPSHSRTAPSASGSLRRMRRAPQHHASMAVQAGKKEEVPEASAKLRADVLAFVALTPQKLVDKFGVGDIVGDL